MTAKTSLGMRTIIPVLFAGVLGAVLLLTYQFSTRHSRWHEPKESENVAAHELWDYLRLRNPATGEIPRGIHARELAYARSMPAGSLALKGVPTIHTTGWNAAGPINTGGRTRAIGIDTMDEANVLIATAQGGVFRSTDSGNTWVRTTAPGELKNMSSLVQDHRAGKTNTWYAGTGELISTTWRRSAINTDAVPHFPDIGNGIYKSTDDGVSWNVLPSTVDATPFTLDSAFDGVWDIVVDNSRHDSDIVYAAGYGAIMRSNNGGASWQHVLGDGTHISLATDVTITSSGVAYAFLSGQTADGNISSTAGVWRSTDGLHWVNITPTTWPVQTGRMRIAIAPSNETMVYIGGVDPGLGYGTALYKYTYRSGTGVASGGTWEDRSQNVPSPGTAITSNGLDTYNGYTIVLEVHPTDPNIVFFGGTNLYRSWDGFATSGKVDWIGGYDPSNGQYGEQNNDHPDHHALVFLPSNPSQAYDATDGGMYMTANVLDYNSPAFPVLWNDINYNDQASILYDVALDHATAGDTTVLGGFQDQGSWLSYDSANIWVQYNGGDGCYCAMADGRTAYYMSSQDGYVSRWTIGKDYSFQGYAGMTPANSAAGQFVTPWMLDPANTDQMYFVANNTLWRNSDLGGVPDNTYPNYQYSTDINWEELTNCDLATGQYITALGMSVVPAHRLYYGSSDGHLYRVDSANVGSPKPREITGSIFPKNAFISCIAVDPENADSIVVCFSNYEVISIFASNDGGTTWHNASGNLEQNPDGSGDGPSVRWVTIVHQHGETLYLCGTSVGLFSTTDISGPNVTWTPEGQNTIGYAIVENIDARQSDGFVAIATQGSGVFTTHVLASPSAVGAAVAPEAFAVSVSPNPAASLVTVRLGMGGTQGPKMRILDLTGKAVLPEMQLPAGADHYTFDCSRLPSGTYFVQVQLGDAVETRKLLIER